MISVARMEITGATPTNANTLTGFSRKRGAAV
jgi:hypothetical protein